VVGFFAEQYETKCNNQR